jgi:hypothetical protein
VVQKMEGVETRASYTKEYWDEAKEMLSWKPRQREKDRHVAESAHAWSLSWQRPFQDARLHANRFFFFFLCHVQDFVLRLIQFFTHVI